MNRRFISALFALSFSFSPAIAACGGDDSGDSQAVQATLSGVYRPLDQGAIGSITFSGSQDYLLMPSGCAGGGCAELGTYRLDTASRVLLLEDGKTHQKRSIALEILETTTTSASLVQSIAPLDLVEPGQQLSRTGQETTTGGGQQLATGGNATTGAASQLLDLIKQLVMNGQKMKQDDQGGGPGGAMPGGAMPGGGAGAMPDPMNPMPMNDPKVDCKQGIPNKDTPLSEVASYFARCPGGP